MDEIDGTVKFFPYRTATVGGVFLDVPRQTTYGLEEHLAHKAGVRADNHTVFEIVQDDRPPAYVMFSDFTTRFGTSVTEQRW